MLLAVLGLAVRTHGTWCATFFAALSPTLRLTTIFISILITIATIFIKVISHETIELGTKIKIELKRVDSVEVVQIIGYIVSLFELLHDLVIFRIHVLVATIVNVLGFFLAFKHIEEGVLGDGLCYDTLFSSLLIFLCLFHLFLCNVHAFFPVNSAPLNFNCLVSVVVSNRSEGESFVSEVLILSEPHSNGKFGLGKLDLSSVQRFEMFQHLRILLGNDCLKHSMILDCDAPEVGHSNFVLEVVNICGNVRLGFFSVSLLLLLCLDNSSNCSLNSLMSLVKLDAGFVEVRRLAVNNLVSLLQEREFSRFKSFRELADFNLEEVIDLAALI